MQKQKQKPNIKVSEELKRKLDRLGRKGDSYEKIIEGLFSNIQGALNGKT